MFKQSSHNAYLNRPLFLAPFGQQDFISLLADDVAASVEQVSNGFLSGLKNLLPLPDAAKNARSNPNQKPYCLTPAMLAGTDPDTPDLWDWTDDRVAVIRIKGPLLDRAVYWRGELYRDGYDRIAAAVAQAQASPDITGIMIQFDTPGGLVDGCFEAVREIRFMRQAGGKPIWASICDCAASAGYALASACDTIIATETAITGSIGVIVLLTQTTELHKKIGIQTVPIQFGDFKTDGAGWKEFTDGEISRLQSMVAELGHVFVDHVAQGRSLTSDAVIAQQAGIYAGKQGIRSGLVDAIGTRAEAMTAFKDHIKNNPATAG